MLGLNVGGGDAPNLARFGGYDYVVTVEATPLRLKKRRERDLLRLCLTDLREIVPDLENRHLAVAADREPLAVR